MNSFTQKPLVIFIIVSAFMIIGVGAFAFWGKFGFGVPLQAPKAQENSIAPNKKINSLVKAGYGWSQKANPVDAAKEAVDRMKIELNGQNPQWAMVFSSVDYNADLLLGALNKELGTGVKITGITSWQGVMNSTDWHKGPAVAVLGIFSPQITFGVGSVEITEGKGREAAKEATRLALEDAGKTPNQKPKIILMNSVIGQEEDTLKGIADFVGSDVPVLGATAGDNDLTGKWRQFANSKVYKSGLVITAIYTDLKVGYMFSSGLGYLRVDKQGIVTKTTGRTIYEINGRPAADVYNEWLGGEIDNELLKKETNIVRKGILDPLAVAVTGKAGITYYLTVHPIFINYPERSLTSVAAIEKGQTISIMKGSAEAHQIRPPLVIRMARAVGEIEENEVSAGIAMFCACTHMVLGDEGVRSIIPNMGKAFGGAPFIGAFTFGEQGPVPGVGNRHQNLIQNVLIFGKD